MTLGSATSHSKSGAPTTAAPPVKLMEDAEVAAIDMQQHLTQLSKDLTMYSKRSKRKKRQETSAALPGLASTWDSSTAARHMPQKPGLSTAWGTPEVLGSPGPKQYIYHGPSMSIVHENVYPELERRPSPGPRTGMPTETRIERRKRKLQNVLNHKLRRQRWETATQALHRWRVGAAEVTQRNKMLERLGRDQEEAQREMAFLRRLEDAMKDLYSGMIEDMQLDGGGGRGGEGSQDGHTDTSVEAMALTDDASMTGLESSGVDSSMAVTPEGYDEMLMKVMDDAQAEAAAVAASEGPASPAAGGGLELEEWMHPAFTTDVAPEVKEISKTWNIPVHPRDLHVTNNILQSRLLAAR